MEMKTAIVFQGKDHKESKTFRYEKCLIKYAQSMFDKYENPTVEIWGKEGCIKVYG